MRKTAVSDRLLTLKEYLALEERSEIRHEYVHGEVYAMAGATTRHNRITGNLYTALRAACRKTPCEVYFTDVKVQASRDRVYYPDIVVACGQAAHAELIIDAPTLIVEVTSPSTRATDRREKRDGYCSIPSLHHYLIVEQRYRGTILYTRTESEWVRCELSGDDVLDIFRPRASLPLDEIYDGITLPPMRVGEGEEEWDAR